MPSMLYIVSRRKNDTRECCKKYFTIKRGEVNEADIEWNNTTFEHLTWLHTCREDDCIVKGIGDLQQIEYIIKE